MVQVRSREPKLMPTDESVTGRMTDAFIEGTGAMLSGVSMVGRGAVSGVGLVVTTAGSAASTVATTAGSTVSAVTSAVIPEAVSSRVSSLVPDMSPSNAEPEPYSEDYPGQLRVSNRSFEFATVRHWRSN